MTEPQTATSQCLTVWHDGNCPLCQREIALMRRLDKGGAIEFLDVHETEDQSCPLTREALLARFHACEDGKLLSGAAAFAAIWRAIPMLRPFGLMARFPPMLWLMERAYLLFLRVRPRIQRLLR